MYEYEEELFEKTARLLKEAGLHTVRSIPDQLIFQGICPNPKDSGKSAWLTRFEGLWLVYTWGARLYFLPEDVAVIDFCHAFVNQTARSSIVSSDICHKFGALLASDRRNKEISSILFPEPRQIAKNLKERGFTGVRCRLGVVIQDNSIVPKLEIFWRGHLWRYTIRTATKICYYIFLRRAVVDFCADCLSHPEYQGDEIPKDLVTKYYLRAKETYMNVTQETFDILAELYSRPKFTTHDHFSGCKTEEIRVHYEHLFNDFLMDLRKLYEERAFKSQIDSRIKALWITFPDYPIDQEVTRYLEEAMAAADIDDWLFNLDGKET